MNLIVGFVIVMCLVINEALAPDVVTDAGQRILMVGLISMLVPGLALVQTITLSRQLRFDMLDDGAKQKQLQRISNFHSIGWLVISLITMGLLRWPDVVRSGWDDGGIPLLTELLVLAPVVFSLLLSWGIFFDVQKALERSFAAPAPDAQTSDLWTVFKRWLALSQRTSFVLIRFRSYLLIVLVPVLAAVLVNDMLSATADLRFGYRVLLWTASGIAFLAVFPFIMLRTWKCRCFDNEVVHRSLRQACRRLKLGVFDVRIWDTGNRVINAVVTGVIPGTRIILLSDRLVREFSVVEMLAVTRHEAGHIQLRHLPIRMLFILFPLLLLTIDQACYFGVTEWGLAAFKNIGFSDGQSAIVGVLLYFLYLIPMLAWLSRQMEFEADWFAVHSESASEATESDASAPGQSAEFDGMSLAIARLATHSPRQLLQGTLFYPSLRQRLNRTRRAAQSTTGPEEVRQRVRFRRWLINVTVGLLISTVAVQALLSTAIH